MGKAMSLDMKLRSMCLTGMVSQVEPMAQRAQKEGWTFIRYVEYLCDVELAERSRRKTERLIHQ